MLRTGPLIGGLLAVLTGVTSAHAEVRSFADPKHGGYAVSYCSANGDVCGERVADAWCRSHGFQSAVDWSVRLGRDLSTTTLAIDSEALCRGAQCESFASISCETPGRAFSMPALGGLDRSTIITPSRRTAEIAVSAIEYQVQVPGCQQREPGIFYCDAAPEYQQCRELFSAAKVFGCRSGLSFADASVEAVAAAVGTYRLELKSSAAATVYQGRRGEGKLRGDADLTLSFDIPAIDARDWCLHRDRYLYHPSGPKGGSGDIDDTADCDALIEASFEPHEDNLLEAYDLCEGSASWGEELQGTTDIIVAAVFHIGSARPDFRSTYGSQRSVASYLTVKAPLEIDCKN